MATAPLSVIWIVRRITGYRLAHVLGAAVVLLGAVAAVTLGSWWLAGRADAALGPLGVVVVLLGYACTVVLGLALAALLAARLTVARVRRRAAALGFSPAR